MICYSVDTEPRKKITAILALIALGITYIPGSIFPAFSFQFGPLSTLGVFGILFFLFDRFLWKYVPGTGIPNISGTWSGKINRGTEPGKTDGKIADVTAKITQTWTRMDVVFRGTHSFSRAEVAGLMVNNPNHIELCYAYHKRPNDATGSGHEYSNGYTRLIFEKTSQSETLIGRYFSDEFRGGTITMAKANLQKA